LHVTPRLTFGRSSWSDREAGGHLSRPDQATLVVRGLGDGSHGAGDPDAVAAHGHRHELADLVEHLAVQRLGARAAQLDDVAHLHAAGELQRTGAVGRGGAGSTSAASITPSQVKSRPATTRGPTRQRIVESLSEPSTCGPGAARDQRGMAGEVGERLDLGGGRPRREAPGVDLAVAGQADDQGLAVPSGCTVDDDVLQRPRRGAAGVREQLLRDRHHARRSEQHGTSPPGPASRFSRRARER
jgi:hypothetical protein